MYDAIIYFYVLFYFCDSQGALCNQQQTTKQSPANKENQTNKTSTKQVLAFTINTISEHWYNVCAEIVKFQSWCLI